MELQVKNIIYMDFGKDELYLQCGKCNCMKFELIQLKGGVFRLKCSACGHTDSDAFAAINFEDV